MDSNTESKTATAAEVRQWLRDQGETPGQRGRIATASVERFEKATGRTYQAGA